MPSLTILACVVVAAVTLGLYSGRREVARRAAGVKKPNRAPVGCATLMFGAALYAAFAMRQRGAFIATAGFVATLIVLTLATLVMVSVLQTAAPRWFPSVPIKPSGSSAKPEAPAEQQTALTAYAISLPSSAFGRPAAQRESIGPWLSSRGNNRNTAWTPALGPASNPKLAWRWRIEGEPGSYNHLIGGPCIDGNGIAYIGTSRGLTALNPDGTKRWTIGVDDAAAPALDGKGNIVSAFAKRLLVATPSGEATWHECDDLRGRAVTIGDDGAIYVAGGGSGDLDGGRLTAFDASGSKRWSIKTIRGVDYPPAISPQGVVFFSSHDSIVWNSDDPSVGYDRFQRLSATGEELELDDRNDEGHGDVWGATAAMSLEDGREIVGIGGEIRVGGATLARKGGGVPALTPAGILYIGSKGLLAIDLVTGEEKWRCAEAFGLPAVAGDGTIYAADGGTIVAVSPNGDVLWKWTAPEETGRYFGSVVSLAIGTERTLYVTTLSEVIALR